MKWLVSHGCSVKSTNNLGDTPLLDAAYGNKMETVNWLVKNGSDVSEKNQLGRTALLLASCAGHTEIIQRLLELGAESQISDAEGNTAIHLAAMFGKVEAVAFLYSSGLDLQATNHDGHNAIWLGICSGKTKMLDWFVQCGVDIDCPYNGMLGFLMCAYNDKPDALRFYLEQGCDLTRRSSLLGGGALDLALGNDALCALEYLLGLDVWSRSDLLTALKGAARGVTLTAVLLLNTHPLMNLVETAEGERRGISFETDVDLAQFPPRVAEILRLCLSPLGAAAMGRFPHRLWHLLRFGENPHHDAVRSRGLKLTQCLDLMALTGPNELCPRDDVCSTSQRLVSLATRPWCPATHGLYGPCFREAALVYVWLFGALARVERVETGLPRLPVEIQLHIISLRATLSRR